MLASYQTTHLTDGRLQVTSGGLDPLSPFVLLAAAGAVFLLYRFARSRNPRLLIGLLLWTLPWIIAAGLSGRGASILLDRAQNTATLREPTVFWYRTEIVPLSAVQGAQLHPFGSSSFLVLVLRNGNETDFPVKESGQEEALRAINGYLGVGSR